MSSQTPVLLVTGGAQGIGKGISVHFLNRQWCVTAADIDEEAGNEFTDEMNKEKDRFLFVAADVGDDVSAKHCIEQTLNRFGRIDVLVNNAGIANQHFGNLHTPVSNWEQVLRTNLTGCFLMSRHAATHLENGGSIINIASTRALQSEPDSEAYAASKGGLIALTHAMAISLGPRIRVNCISPGWITVSEWKKSKLRKSPQLSENDHTLHPCGRVGTPKDIAALVEYLASDAAGFITGQNFVVDGGMTKKMIYD